MCLILTLLVGCIVPQSDNEGNEGAISGISLTVTITTSATPTSSVTSHSKVTVMLTPSATPTQTATATLSPSITPTATLTSIPTLTPMPTIDPRQRGQMYAELMSNNGGCELPCWWGFELGNTSLDEIRQFYETFDVYTTEQNIGNGISILEILFVDPQIENGEQIPHALVTQDGILIEVEIQLNSHPAYQVETILQRLGQPADVWMWTIPEPFYDKLPADFILYFPEPGVLMGYRTGSVKVDDSVNVCFDEIGGATIHLWEPSFWDQNNEKGIVDRASQAGSAFRLESYHPIEEVSNWDVEQFYSTLTDPTHLECLETPSEIWTAP